MNAIASCLRRDRCFHKCHYCDFYSIVDRQDRRGPFADRLAIAQPYLAELSRDGTLRGLVSMMARGSRAVREGDIAGDQLDALFERFGGALSALFTEALIFFLGWTALKSSVAVSPWNPIFRPALAAGGMMPPGPEPPPSATRKLGRNAGTIPA